MTGRFAVIVDAELRARLPNATAARAYANGTVQIFDTETGEQLPLVAPRRRKRGRYRFPEGVKASEAATPAADPEPEAAVGGDSRRAGGAAAADTAPKRPAPARPKGNGAARRPALPPAPESTPIQAEAGPPRRTAWDEGRALPAGPAAPRPAMPADTEAAYAAALAAGRITHCPPALAGEGSLEHYSAPAYETRANRARRLARERKAKDDGRA